MKVGKRYQFLFLGNTVFDNESIRQWITPDVLGQAGTIRFIEKLITDKYKSLGYHFCKVTSVVESSVQRRVQTFKFQIEEGNRVLIDSLVVNGASEIGDSGFRSLFYENGAGVISRGVFWEEGLEATCKNMLQALEEMG